MKFACAIDDAADRADMVTAQRAQGSKHRYGSTHARSQASTAPDRLAAARSFCAVVRDERLVRRDDVHAALEQARDALPRWLQSADDFDDQFQIRISKDVLESRSEQCRINAWSRSRVPSRTRIRDNSRSTPVRLRD
jgi:hypothetical protein